MEKMPRYNGGGRSKTPIFHQINYYKGGKSKENEMKAVSITRETDICTELLLENPKEECHLVKWKHDITVNCKGIGC